MSGKTALFVTTGWVSWVSLESTLPAIAADEVALIAAGGVAVAADAGGYEYPVVVAVAVGGDSGCVNLAVEFVHCC